MLPPFVIPLVITFIALTTAIMVQLTDRYLNPRLVILHQR